MVIGAGPGLVMVWVGAEGLVTRFEVSDPGGGAGLAASLAVGARVEDCFDAPLGPRVRRLVDRAGDAAAVTLESLEVTARDAGWFVAVGVVPQGDGGCLVVMLVVARVESEAAAVAAVAALLAGAVSPKPHVESLLGSVGGLVGCDAVSLLEIDLQAGELVLRAGWLVDDPGPPALPQSWPLEVFPALLARLEGSPEPIMIRSLDALPTDAQVARLVLGRLGIDAFVAVPIPGTPRSGLVMMMWRAAPAVMPSEVLLGVVRDLIAYLPGAMTPGRILEGILEHSDDLVAVVDADGEVQYLNSAASAFVGPSPSGPELVERIAPVERPVVQAALEQARNHPGEPVPLRLRAANQQGVVVTLDGSCLGLVGTDLSVVRVQPRGSRHGGADRHVEQLLRNPLTGLTSRVGALEDLRWRLGHRGAHPLAVVLIDLDAFRRVNDSFGHDAGDEVLAQVAGRLLHAVDDHDTVAHIDGDEFVVLATISHETSGDRAAGRIAQRVAHAIAEPIDVAGHALKLTASIGFSVTSSAATPDADELLRDADTALAYAKKRGRNRIEAFDPELRVELDAALALETGLHDALAAGALSVAYQPIIDLTESVPVGVEALARWPRAELGPIGPSVFVPLAEQTGLIHQLGDWLLHTTAAQHAVWARPDLELAVNVSIRQLERPDFPATATSHYVTAGVAAEAVVFEVTETSYAHADATVIAGLEELRAEGFRVALDDFGAGNSSFDRIRRYPIDVVKIDRSYTELVDGDAADRGILKAMIAMTHALGATVVAEGVERASQRDALGELGCDQAQGYLFSEPLDPTSVTAFFDAE